MASCLTPIPIKPTKERPAKDGFLFHIVPCGKCPACRLRRIQGWVFRLKQEEKIHNASWFVTFTYDQPPISSNGFMTLRRSDFTNFMKRLRTSTLRKTIKYYACGEYGSKTYRPHFHAIIFDATPQEIEDAWLSGNNGNDAVLRGLLHFGQVSDDSIAYTAKYMAKESRIPVHDHDDREPEYSVMSKRLGANYLTPEIIKYHNDGTSYKSFLTMPGGATHAMPRYYRDKIFTEQELEHMNSNLADKFNSKFEEDVRKLGYDMSNPQEFGKAIEEYYRKLHYSVRQANKDFLTNNKRNII